MDITPTGVVELAWDATPSNKVLTVQQCPGDTGVTDTDLDGINDRLEVFYGLGPTKPDTDMDGVDDGTEDQRGTDPLDPADGTRRILESVHRAPGGKPSARTKGVLWCLKVRAPYRPNSRASRREARP